MPYPLRLVCGFFNVPQLFKVVRRDLRAGADPGEVKWVNFHPPFSEPPLTEPSITFWAVNIVEDISG